MGNEPARPTWFKWAMILAIIIVALPVCALLALQTRWGSERVRELAVQAIRDELGLSATLENVQVDLLPASLSLVVTADDIVLDDPVYGRFATADGLRIRPSLGAILLGEIDLQTIEIDRPAVRLVVHEGEIRNLPRPSRPSDGPMSLPFDRLEAHEALLTIEMEPHGRAVLEGVELVMDVDNGDEITLRVETDTGRIEHVRGQEAIQRVEMVAHLDPNGIEAERLVLRTPYVHLSAQHAWLPLPFDHGYRGEVRARVNLARLAHLPVAWDLPPLAGRVEIDGELRGTPEGPEGHGRVVIEGGQIDGRWGLGELTLDVEASPEQLRVVSGRGELIRGGGVVDMEGTIGFGEGFPIDMVWDVHGLQLNKLMEQLGVTRNAIVQWDMDGRLVLRGTLDPLEFGGPASVNSRNFLVTQDAWHVRPARRVMGVRGGRLTATTRVSPAGLAFQRIRAETSASVLTGDALIGFDDTVRVDVTAQQIDIGDISPLVGFQIGGRGTGHVLVQGDIGDPQLTGSYDVRDFTFNEFRFGDVTGNANMEKHAYAMRFTDMRATKGEGRYSIDSLFLDFSDSRFVATAGIDSPHMRLADLYHMFRFDEDERFQAFQSTGHGHIDVRYTLGWPGDGANGTMLIDADVRMPESNFAGWAFTDGHLIGRWRWLDYARGVDGGEGELVHFSVQKGDGTISATGRMELDSRLNVTATGDQIAVRDTEGLGDRMTELGGIYGFVADIRGTLDVPRVGFDVGLTGLTWGQALLGDGRLYVRLTDRSDPWVRAAREWDARNPPAGEPCAHARVGFARGRWAPDPEVRTVDGMRPALARPMAYLMCGEMFGGRVLVDMASGWTSVYPLRGQLRFDEMDLGPLLAQDGSAGDLRGSMTGEVHFSGGDMLRTETLSGDMKLTELRVGTAEVQIENELPVDVRFRRGDYVVHQGVFRGPSSRVRVRGGGSIERGLALTVDGRIDVGVLATLSPRVHRAHGRIALRVDVNGPLDAPTVFGEASVSDAGFLFASLPEPIDGLNGQITFNQRRIDFTGFEAQVARGRITLDGSATLAGRGLEGYELEITGRDLAFAPDDGVEVGLSTDARLVWSQGERLPLLTGTVRLDRVSYERPINLSPTLGELYRSRRREIDQYDPAADQVAVDLRFENGAPIRIANNLAEAEIDIDDTERPFRVVGTDQRYGVLGRLVVRRGILRLRNTDFEVRRGVIVLEDEMRVDPQFDIRAETEFRRSGELTGPDWRIMLRAHGTFDAFQLDATSEPELSQEDVMLLLTVGMTRSEAEQLQAGDVTSTAALEALAAVTGVDREVRRAVPVIDDFSITSVYSPRTNRTEPRVNIGKRITERVRVTASTGLASEEREVETGLEVSLGRHTSLRASYDNVNNENSSFGNVGVDIRWRLEFE